jgi:hypothetical protein
MSACPCRVLRRPNPALPVPQQSQIISTLSLHPYLCQCYPTSVMVYNYEKSFTASQFKFQVGEYELIRGG